VLLRVFVSRVFCLDLSVLSNPIQTHQKKAKNSPSPPPPLPFPSQLLSQQHTYPSTPHHPSHSKQPIATKLSTSLHSPQTLVLVMEKDILQRGKSGCRSSLLLGVVVLLPLRGRRGSILVGLRERVGVRSLYLLLSCGGGCWGFGFSGVSF
jgi:hypothetical protein